MRSSMAGIASFSRGEGRARQIHRMLLETGAEGIRLRRSGARTGKTANTYVIEIVNIILSRQNEARPVLAAAFQTRKVSAGTLPKQWDCHTYLQNTCSLRGIPEFESLTQPGSPISVTTERKALRRRPPRLRFTVTFFSIVGRSTEKSLLKGSSRRVKPPTDQRSRRQRAQKQDMPSSTWRRICSAWKIDIH